MSYSHRPKDRTRSRSILLASKLGFAASVFLLLLFGSSPAQSLCAAPAVPSSKILMPLKGCVNIATSVDGFIAGKNGDLDWLNSQPQIKGEDFGFAEFLKSVDVMIMGRNTFDVVVGFGRDNWPYGDLPLVV